MVSLRTIHSLSTTTTTTTTTTTPHDVTVGLARGATARHVPNQLSTLTDNEIDKDVRHFQAYRSAVISYRQHYYTAVNRMIMEPVEPISLPVRIDPEEEKRLNGLRKKIARAEWYREELEQQYVALRAHYVQVSQELQQQVEWRASRVALLQETIASRSAAVGLLRARLQMTRDVRTLLQRRNQILETVGGPSSSTAAAVPAAGGDDLESIWNQVEEDLRKILAGNKKAPKKPVQWPATKMPATPSGVPLLLSALSTAPEKSFAWNSNSAMGAPKSSLTWLINHLPDPEGSAEEENVKEETEVDSLQREVDVLRSELQKERLANQDMAGQIAATRSHHDEWVAMLALVRHETEAVLHRHNIVLDSEPASAAAEQMHQQLMHDRETAAAVTTAAVSADAQDRPDGQEGGEGDEAAPAERVDDANDGDDEDSVDEEEDAGWNKRPAEEPPSVSPSKKRRKL